MYNEISQNAERWARRVFSAGIVLVCAAVVPIPTVGFVLPKIAAGALTAAVCGGALLAAFVRGGDARRARDGRVFAGYAVFLVASLLWSQAPLLSVAGAPPRFEGVLALESALALGFCAFLLCRDGEGRAAVARAVAVANAVVVLYGFLQWIRLDPLAPFWESEIFLGRIFSLLGQPNFLGSFILLTLPVVAAEGWRRGRAALTFSAVLSVLNVVVLLATASRGALLGLAVLAVVALRLLPGAVRARFLRHKRHLALAALVLALVGMQSFGGRFAVSTQAAGALGSRGVIWRAAAAMIRARPIGYGIETTGTLSARFLPKDLYEYEALTTRIDRAHSQPLDLLLTTGPAGLVAYYGIAAAVIAMAARRKDPLLRAAAAGMIGYIASLLVGFETFATMTVYWVLAGMILGSAVVDRSAFPRGGLPAPYREKALVSGRPAGKGGSAAILACFTAVSVLTAFGSLRWISARLAMQRAESLLAAGSAVEAVQAYARAARGFPWDRSLLIEAAETALIARGMATNEPGVRALDAFIAETVAALDRLTGGGDGLTPLFRGWHAALQGDRDGLDRNVEAAVARAPALVTTYRIAARSYAIAGDREKERTMIERLRAILPPYWDDPESDRGRILRKENPWLDEIGNTGSSG